MKKMLFLLLVVAMCAAFVPSANAKTTLYDFTFRDVNGNAFCDGLFVYLYGSPKALVDGYHWNNNGCSGTSVVNGFKAGVPFQYQYGATGATMVIGDLDQYFGTHIIWLVNPKFNTWTMWFSGGGAGEYVQAYGTFVNFTKTQTKGTKVAGAR